MQPTHNYPYISDGSIKNEIINEPILQIKIATPRNYTLVNIFNIASKQFFHPKVVSFFYTDSSFDQNIITRTTMLTMDSNAPMPSNSKLSHSNNFQFYTTILSNEVTPRSDRHQNQQMKQICIISHIIVKTFKNTKSFYHVPTTILWIT